LRIEKAHCGSDTTYATVGEYSISGWSGWNSIPLSAYFGGGDTQTNNIRRLRLTYYFTKYATDYGESESTKAVKFSVSKLAMCGETSWSNSGGYLSYTGHLYGYDINKNATFPGTITATEFIGNLSGVASNITVSNSDVNNTYKLVFHSGNAL
jgi:hypothetical protein